MKYLFMITLLSFTSFGQLIKNNSESLYSDFRAYRVGDAVMVLITESLQADNGSSTRENRSSDNGAGLNLGFGSLGSVRGDAEISNSNDFRANGNNSRSETIQSRLSAKVVNIDDNGNLQIEGKRTTKINGETQTIIIRGLIRQVDIMSNNSIFSYNIMDLTLLIEGEGNVTEIQEPGLITKFIRFLF